MFIIFSLAKKIKKKKLTPIYQKALGVWHILCCQRITTKIKSNTLDGYFSMQAANINKVLLKSKMQIARGNFSQAENAIQAVLYKYPKNRTALSQLKELYKRQAGINPEAAKYENSQLAKLSQLYKERQYSDALVLASHLTHVCPEKYFVWYIHAGANRMLGNFKESIRSYEQAIVLQPSNPDLYNDYGLALKEVKEFKNAVLAFQKAISLDHKNPKPFNNIGLLFKEADEPKRALEFFHKAEKTGKPNAETLSNIAMQYSELCIYDQALLYVNKAMDLAMENPIFIRNKAIILNHLGQHEKALELHRVADNMGLDGFSEGLLANFKFNRSMALMACGHTSEAWRNFFHRFEYSKFPSKYRNYSKPRLRNMSDAKGKRILFWREQGLGDEFMFLNLMNKFIEEVDCDVIYEGSFRALSLIQRSFPKFVCRRTLIDKKTQELTSIDEKFDYHLPIGDLPILLELKQSDNDHLVSPYLKADPQKSIFWKSRLLENDKKIKIGFSWRSQDIEGYRKIHYTKLSDWEPLLLDERFLFVSLQYDDITEDLKEISDKAANNLFRPDCNLKDDLESVSAIIDNCDLVISPFNAVLMQAAAAGVKTISYSPHANPWLLNAQTISQPFNFPWISNNRTYIFEYEKRNELIHSIKQDLENNVK